MSEVEEYERIHGPGSGGTIADPKNTKPKSRATPRTSEIMPSVVTLGNAQVQLPRESPTPPPAASAPNNLLFPRPLSQRTPSGGFVQNDIVYSDDEEEEKVEVKEAEKVEDSTMQDTSFSFTEDKPTVQSDITEVKEVESLAPIAAEAKNHVQEMMEIAADGDAEMTTPLVANQEAPTTSVVGEPSTAETDQSLSNPLLTHSQEPSRSISPAQNEEKDKEQPTTYSQAQRELQGNNESGDSDNEDSIVVKDREKEEKDRLRSPPKRTRAGRFVKKTSMSKSPAYSYRRKGSDF